MNPTSPPEIQRLRRLADAMSALAASPAGPALDELLREFTEDCTERALSPDTPEDKRPGWAGGAHALREFSRELQDLKSGAWRQWPTVKKHLEAGEEEG